MNSLSGPPTWGLWSPLPGGALRWGPNPRALAAGLPPQACTGQRAGHPQGPETLGPGDVLLGLPFIPFYYRAEKITRFYFVRLSKLQHMVAYTLEFLHLYILKSMPGLLRSFKFSVTEKETGTIQTMCHLSSPSVTRWPSPTHTRGLSVHQSHGAAAGGCSPWTCGGRWERSITSGPLPDPCGFALHKRNLGQLSKE